MTSWDGLPFTVEWQGKERTVFVQEEVIGDLGRLTGNQPDSVHIGVFEKYRGAISDGAKRALQDPSCVDRHGRVHVLQAHIPELGV